MVGYLSRWQGTGAFAAVSQGMAANMLTAAATVLSGIVTARYLGAAGRGELAALTTLPAFVSFVVTFGLPSSVVYHARRDAEKGAAVTAAALILALAAGAIGATGAYVAVPFVLTELAPEWLPAARALAVCVVLGSLSNVSMAVLQAQQRFIAFNYVRVAQPILQLLGTLLLGAAGWLTPLTAALVVLLAGVPGIVWTCGWIVARVRPAWAHWRAAARELSSYGARAYSAELLSALAAQVDRVIVVGIFAPAVMGMYVVALSLSRLVTMFPSAIATVLFPKASGRSQDDVLELTTRASGATLLVMGATALVLVALGPELLTLVYGADFEGAKVAFLLLLAEAVLTSLVQVQSQAFMALNRPGLITWQYGVGVAVAVPLLFLLAPQWGAEGAAAALLLASVARLACTHWCFTRVLGIEAPRMFASSVAVLRTVLAAARR